jgi:uncharacterized C2H2 Zn-finger protein
MIKTINDVDSLYEKGPHHTAGGYECPACGKTYKTSSGAIKHMSKKDCYSLVDLFKATMTEMKAYSLYKNLLSMLGKDSNNDIRGFRKSPYYNGCIRFHLMTVMNSVNETQYRDWLIEIKGLGTIPKLLSTSIKPTTLKDFRIFLQAFDQFIDSESFYRKSSEMLIKDPQFFLRSLEKSHISLKWLLANDSFPFEEVMNSLPLDDQMRFEDFANAVLLYKV